MQVYNHSHQGQFWSQNNRSQPWVKTNKSCNTPNFCLFSSISQSCANQLIQDSMMYRFLLFPDQQSMTWKDQITFTELMGDGNAFPDAKSPGRKVSNKADSMPSD